MRTLKETKRAAEVCIKLGLTGLVLVGATETLTDGLQLSQFFVD